MFDLRSTKVIVFGALAMLIAFTLPSFSTAMFTSNSSTTATVSAAADWASPKVSIVNLPVQVSGTQTLQAQASDNHGSGVARVIIETRPAGAGTWTTVCTDTSAPYQCSWNTNALTNGNFEVRARAIDGAGLVGTSEISPTNVANGRLLLIHPGNPVQGTPELTANMTSGWFLHTLQIDYRPSGGRWQSIPWCSGITRQLSCDWNTTRLDNGDYDVRARAIWGVTTDEHIIYNVTVNNPASGRAADGAVTTTGARSNGIDKDQVEPGVEAPTEETTPVEPDPVGPVTEEEEFEDETVVEPAPQEPPTVPGDDDEAVPGEDEDEAVIEDAPLRGASIQATDGGTGAGSLDEGDSFTFTYSGEVDLTTVLPGWSGETTAVSVRLRDGNLLGAGAQDDTLDVLAGATPVELGQVNLGADVVVADQEIVLPATMTAQMVTVDGVDMSTVTVTLGPVDDDVDGLQPAGTAPVLSWTPSAAVTTLAGLPCEVQPVPQLAGGSF